MYRLIKCHKGYKKRQFLTASEIWTSTFIQLPIKMLEDDVHDVQIF